MSSESFETVTHDVDFCVVGGGLAGLLAAVSAARHGASVALMQDRPMLGGNASSEVRVHVCGADRHNHLPDRRETGILEEVRLDNCLRNPTHSFAIWDTILYEKARLEPNVTLLLNCSCLDAGMDGATITDVTGWQTTTQQYHRVRATIFADCSGDGVLAPLTGAEFRRGREARDEYGESIAPEQADDRTMGMSCLFKSVPTDVPQPFIPPSWAKRFDSCDDLPYGAKGHSGWWKMGFWWIELGGEHDSIADTETLRDELLAIVYGVWDHIKNRCPHCHADNWAIEWVNFIPGKRESRRYVGDHVLTQNDIEAEGRFDDLVAYGGWSMDDHHPAGFHSACIGAPATIFHPAPSPYGIPYRCLYSRNVDNLMFAGRCHSATHAALSSTRVMGTCGVMGQAIGTAAAIAVEQSIPPRGVNNHMDRLQQTLLADDCYLPWVERKLSDLTANAELSASRGDPEPLRDGIVRPVGTDLHCWIHGREDWVAYTFDDPRDISQATMVFDSSLSEDIQMSYHGNFGTLTAPPQTLVKVFAVDILVDGEWQEVAAVNDNHQRHVRVPIDRRCEGVRLRPGWTYGAQETRLYGFYVD